MREEELKDHYERNKEKHEDINANYVVMLLSGFFVASYALMKMNAPPPKNINLEKDLNHT